MFFNRPVAIILLLLALTLFVFQRYVADEDATLRRSRLLMGTVIEIVARGTDKGKLGQAVTEAFAEMARIEALMSPDGGPGSDVARMSGSIEEGTVAPETAAVIELGLEVAEKSGGAFDLTLGRLKNLWGFDRGTPRVPAADEIAEALAGTGPQALRLEDRRLIKADPELKIDLGGIAKGYALDRAIAILQAAGIQSASVNAGGDLRLLGAKEDGRSWRIGIQHPRKKDELLATLALQDNAVVTSGDYERSFEQDGRRYHHLFDPRSGYPATASRSVTVVAPSAALADALATAVFVLGPEEGLALLQAYPQAEGLLVGGDGRTVVSDGLRGRLSWP